MKQVSEYMELSEKLQALRKRKGLTQEELAEALFVSRTAVSKWESGRGYPSIDSLKAVSKYFGITIDELLSSDELLTIADEDNRQKEARMRDLLYGLLDSSAALFFFLPIFGQAADGGVRAVSLLTLTAIQPYLKISYFAVTAGMVVWGILMLAMQNCRQALWVQNKQKVSLLLSTVGAMLLIISTQPYAAALLFVFLVIKVIVLLK